MLSGTLRFEYRSLGRCRPSIRFTARDRPFIYASGTRTSSSRSCASATRTSRPSSAARRRELLGRSIARDRHGHRPRLDQPRRRRGGPRTPPRRTSRRRHLAVTPDGPRGPRRVVQPGVVYIASRTGMRDRADRRRLPPAVATEELGLVRRAAAVLAGPVPLRRAAHRSARSCSRDALEPHVGVLQAESTGSPPRPSAGPTPAGSIVPPALPPTPGRTTSPASRSMTSGGGAWERATERSGLVVPPRYWAWLGTRRAVAVAALARRARRRGLHALSRLDLVRQSAHDRPRSDAAPTATRPHPDRLRRPVGDGPDGREGTRPRTLPPAAAMGGRPRGIPVSRASRPSITPSRRLPGIAANGGQDRRAISSHDADELMGWFMGTDPREWKTVGGGRRPAARSRAVRQSVRGRRCSKP